MSIGPPDVTHKVPSPTVQALMEGPVSPWVVIAKQRGLSDRLGHYRQACDTAMTFRGGLNRAIYSN